MSIAPFACYFSSLSLCCWIVRVLCMFIIWNPYQIYDLKIFHSMTCLFTFLSFGAQKFLTWWSSIFPQFIVIHTVKGFGIVNKAEIDVFLELSCFFDEPSDVVNLISGSSAFSKYSFDIWKFTVHVLLNPGLENFEHYFTSMWDECNCAIVWAFFGIAFFWDWNENWPFPVPWPLLSFPILLAYWVQYFHSIIFQDSK